MSSWNRPTDPLASVFPPSTDTGSAPRVSISSWLAADQVPSWLKPFTLDENTRFTRTPDLLLRARMPGHAAPPTGEPATETADVAVEPESQVMALPQRTAEEIEDDDILIDWTGESWAARAFAQETAFTQDGAVEETFTQESPLEESPLEESPLQEPVAEAVDTPESAEAVTLEAEAFEIQPALTAEAEPVASVFVAAEAAGSAEVPAPEMTDEAIVSIEAILEAVSFADIPPSIRRLARLISVASSSMPTAAPDQDLVAMPVETVPVEAYLADAEPIPELSIEDILPVDLAPEAPASEVPAPEILPPEIERVASAPEMPPVAVENAEQAEIAPPALFSAAGYTVHASFGWPIFTPAAETLPVAQMHAEVQAPIAPPVPQQTPVVPVSAVPAPLAREQRPSHFAYELPPLELLAEPPVLEPVFELSEEYLDRNSAALQQTLRDFGVRGDVIDANPGPVVTLYEFEPAPGTKSSRVIGLSADIARSMSAISTRVAVVEGRNVIGIELPNQRRETVWLRELLASQTFADVRARLGICLGKTIGGEPVIVDLARMPHLLVAGTTGSGKSVAINTMILSLLYRLTPEQCRLIMIDPKMLELSVYEGIPHLLTPVVTDPKKAIIALQWAVREMEDRYRKMSRLKVRNIEGFNARVAEARETGEVVTSIVPTGFDKETGEATFAEVVMDLAALPYIVIIVDEMADLMLTAGKDIEGAIQRLAQMARAAGIHLVMATQRPSVDVITGTIKANFPTRISFQVTSKIDSRTILGEMGAETLLGQGDMLYMANGGRISRVHGPFVSDGEVEKVVAHLKAQGRPEYLDAVTSDDEGEDEEDDTPVFNKSALAAEDGADNYEQAVAIVMRDRKASTSYIQRRLQIGYNKAASLMERMENEGIVGAANHAGKREILTSRP